MSKSSWKIYNPERLVKDLHSEFPELNFVDDVIKVKRRKGSKLPKYRFPLGYLIYLTRKIYSGYYKHRVFQTRSSIHYKTLEKWFGEDYHSITDILLEYTDTWSKELGYTRGWSLLPSTRKILDDYFSKEVRQKETNRILGLDGKILSKLPEHGIVRTNDMSGRRMLKEEKFNNNLHSVVKINFDNIQNCIDVIREIKDTGSIGKDNYNKWTKKLLCKDLTPDELTDRRNTLVDLRHIADTELLPKGSIYQHYFEVDSGRVYTQGNTSLQQTYKEIREIVLGGLGYWDYDIRNCHYTIMNYLTDYFGIGKCDSFDEYTNNKKHIRKTISLQLDVDEIIVKKILIAILYGCSKRIKEGNQITDTIGEKKHAELLTNPFISLLFSDRDRLSKGILDRVVSEPLKHPYLQIHGKKKIYYQNIRHKKLNYYDEEGETQYTPKVMAHILQGIESKMLDICLGVSPGELKVLIHDGFITEGRIDESKYIKKIEEETGISVMFDKKPLDCVLVKSKKV